MAVKEAFEVLGRMQKVVEDLKSVELREQIVELRTILADVPLPANPP